MKPTMHPTPDPTENKAQADVDGLGRCAMCGEPQESSQVRTTTHTPGPWGAAGMRIVAQSGKTVAHVQTDGEWMGDARLIAAAPELFAFVADYFETADCGDGGEHPEDKSHGQCWHCTAKRLVSKVNGGVL